MKRLVDAVGWQAYGDLGMTLGWQIWSASQRDGAGVGGE